MPVLPSPAVNPYYKIKMKKIALLVSTAAVCCSALATEVGQGFITEAVFRTMDANSQVAYVAGVLDGAYTAPMFSPAATKRVDLFRVCAAGLQLTPQMLAELTRREVDADPASWSLGANIAVFIAIRKACLAHGFKTEN